MSLGTFGKGTLSLGKGLSKTIDDAYKKYIKGGGKKTKKAFTAEELSKKKQLDKAKQNRQKRNQVSKKEYEKTLPDTFKKKSTALVSLNKNIKNIAEKSLKDKSTGTGTSLVPTGQGKTIKETINPKKIKQNFTLQGKPVDKTIKQTNPNKSKKTGTSLVTIPKGNAGKQTSKNMTNKGKSFLQKYKKQLAGLGLLSGTVPFLIDTKDSETKAKEKKLDKILKDRGPNTFIGPNTSKITKPTTTKVKKQTLPQTKANDYTGKYIDKDGNVAYESISDFFAHMSGKPKKRVMPEKTKRMIGTGNKLKRITAETKGAGKGVKYKAFKAGTKDKTISQKQLDKDAKYKASKAYQLKNMEKVGLMDIIKNPIKAIKKDLSDVTTARRRAKQVAAGDPIAERKYGTGKRTGDKMSYMYPEGVLKFKPDGSVENPVKSYKRNLKSKNRSGFEVTNKSGGGLIASLYDKPEKVETYKGNTSAGRQVKGYGKARKR